MPSTQASSTFVSSDGDGYELQMGRWSRRLAPLLVDFAGLPEGGRVLDLGCGTGNLSAAIIAARSGTSVVGIDLSAPYVAHAKAHHNDARLEFQVADACALPFADASFDHAMSMLVLQFIPDGARAIREMCRVTRPGGSVTAATWDTRGGFVAYRMFFDTAAMVLPSANERRARVYVRPMSRPGELAQAWRAAGLADVMQAMLTIRMDFASFEDYWAPAEGKDGPIAEFVTSLADDDRKSVRSAVERAYLDGEADGPRSYAATAWAVKGVVAR